METVIIGSIGFIAATILVRRFVYWFRSASIPKQAPPGTRQLNKQEFCNGACTACNRSKVSQGLRSEKG